MGLRWRGAPYGGCEGCITADIVCFQPTSPGDRLREARVGRTRPARDADGQGQLSSPRPQGGIALRGGRGSACATALVVKKYPVRRGEAAVIVAFGARLIAVSVKLDKHCAASPLRAATAGDEECGDLVLFADETCCLTRRGALIYSSK
jgi:hypothetical protein